MGIEESLIVLTVGLEKHQRSSLNFQVIHDFERQGGIACKVNFTHMTKSGAGICFKELEMAKS